MVNKYFFGKRRFGVLTELADKIEQFRVLVLFDLDIKGIVDLLFLE